jgi:plasmid stability protein
MASITLKNIPESLHCAYKRRAKANSRSLQSEILQILSSCVTMADDAGELAIDDVAGMLKPQRKGVTVPQMEEGINRSLRESWK